MHLQIIVKGLDAQLIKTFEIGPSILHSKKQAARRRRWFAHLRARKQDILLPPKYLVTKLVFLNRLDFDSLDNLERLC